MFALFLLFALFVLFVLSVLFVLISRVYLYQSPRFICTVHIMSYLARNVLPVIPVLHSFILIIDIICIYTIMSYLAFYVRPIFHIYSSSVNAWCITYFPVFRLIRFSVPSSFFLFSFVSEYKLNPNYIWIYVHLFLLQKKLKRKK